MPIKTNTFSANTQIKSASVNTNFTENLIIANDTEYIYFRNAAGASDGSIRETATDFMEFDIASATGFTFEEGGAIKFAVSHAEDEVQVRDGYVLKVFDATDTNAINIFHDGTDGNISCQGDMKLNPLGNNVIPTSDNDVSLGLTGTKRWKWVYSNNAFQNECYLARKDVTEWLSDEWCYKQLAKIRTVKFSWKGDKEKDIHIAPVGDDFPEEGKQEGTVDSSIPSTLALGAIRYLEKRLTTLERKVNKNKR